MKPYDPEQQLSALVKKLEVGKYFAISVKQAITNYMMLYKGTTLIPNTAVLNNNINIYRHKRTIEKKVFLNLASRILTATFKIW